MKGRELLDAMEYISDDLIEEAAVFLQDRNRYRFITHKWAVTAASIVVLCVSAVALFGWQNRQKSDLMYNNSSSNAGADSSSQSMTGSNNSAVTSDTMGFDTASDEEYDSISNTTGFDNASGEEYDNTQEKKTEQSSKELDLSKPYEETLKVDNAVIIENFPPKSPYQESTDAASSETQILPRKGNYEYSLWLTDALAYYDGDGTNNSEANSIKNEEFYNVYHVNIRIFGDSMRNGNMAYRELELNEDNKIIITNEYERLLELGYDVSLSEDYKLSGLFTKSELDNFDASSDYGYIFSLILE